MTVNKAGEHYSFMEILPTHIWVTYLNFTHSFPIMLIKNLNCRGLETAVGWSSKVFFNITILFNCLHCNLM